MKKIIGILCMVVLVLLQGCSLQKNNNSAKEIRIAEQYGIAYAPVQIMKHKGLMEKHVPGVTVIWEQMSNTTEIREAMVADRLDVGFMAIPPFLIGWDKGMDWKIATGLSSVPSGLVAREKIETIADLDENSRIAVPQPGSVQHILLAMACKEAFNDPERLDNQLVTLSHPDGMNALLSGTEITAHFTSTPYLEKEIEADGFHLILDGEKVFGQKFSFIVGVATRTLHDDNPALYEGFLKAVDEAIEFINNHPEEAAAILTEYYEIDEEEILAYLTADSSEYSTVVKGTEKFSSFMAETKYLSRQYEEIDEILWDNTAYEE